MTDKATCRNGTRGSWVFILFHGKRHPRGMGGAEVAQFLTHLAVDGRVSARTQNQALNALVFLYRGGERSLRDFRLG